MNVCTCPDATTLRNYVLGALDPAGDATVDEHLESCPACQATIDQLDAQTNAEFACLRQPAASVPDDPTLRRLVNRAKALADAPTAAAGRPAVLGNYTLLEPLGAGGMGEVFKAEHRLMKRVVALKVLAPHLVRDPDARARFRREVEAVARLSSPYIVAAYDAGEADGRDFLVMEYVPGRNLADVVRTDGPLPIDRAIDYALQAARGLADAHAAGIVHRDVKPANLLLESVVRGPSSVVQDRASPRRLPSTTDHGPRTTDCRVKILDLGLARLRDGGAALTDAGAMGTAQFMAPEQAADPRSADERADVYGLGCTLFYLLTGRPPYDGEGTAAVLLAHRDRPIPSVRASRRDCPPALDTLVRRMLAKRPQDRPASMRDVIAALEHVRSSPAGAPARAARRWQLPAAAVVALVAAGLLLVVLLWPLVGGRAGREEPPAAPPAAQPAPAQPAPAQPAPAQSAPAPPKKGPVLDLVRVPAGTFWMGASDSDKNAQSDEMPRRQITIRLPFLMGKTEITQGQYEEVMGTNPSAHAPKGRFARLVAGVDTAPLPVESVTWLDAVRFCNRLSEWHSLEPYYKIDGERVTIRGGTGYRLPTEAEWEYACRAGRETTWFFGENAERLGDYAWYAANSGDRPHAVGTKKANPFGLHDMLGNVPEWCFDRYDARYLDRVASTDPVAQSTSDVRVFRGGGWNALATQLRPSARRPLGLAYGGPGSNNLIGFRVVRNVAP